MSLATAAGKRIRQLRVDAGLTPEQLAKGCGLKTAALLRLERGQTSPTVGQLQVLAGFFRLHPTQLLVEGPHPKRASSPRALAKQLREIAKAVVALPDDVG